MSTRTGRSGWVQEAGAVAPWHADDTDALVFLGAESLATLLEQEGNLPAAVRVLETRSTERAKARAIFGLPSGNVFGVNGPTDLLDAGAVEVGAASPEGRSATGGSSDRVGTPWLTRHADADHFIARELRNLPPHSEE